MFCNILLESHLSSDYTPENTLGLAYREPCTLRSAQYSSPTKSTVSPNLLAMLWIPVPLSSSERLALLIPVPVADGRGGLPRP